MAEHSRGGRHKCPRELIREDYPAELLGQMARNGPVLRQKAGGLEGPGRARAVAAWSRGRSRRERPLSVGGRRFARSPARDSRRVCRYAIAASVCVGGSLQRCARICGTNLHSGRQDSNLRPCGPKPHALARLSYAPHADRSPPTEVQHYTAWPGAVPSPARRPRRRRSSEVEAGRQAESPGRRRPGGGLET